MSQRCETVDTHAWHAQYHGHPVRALDIVERGLRQQDKDCIFFAGDSSLDNEYWFEDRGRATNGYEHILSPPESKLDVAYHTNKILEARSPRWACVNTAVEATSLNDRAFGRLLEQGQFLRDRLTERDAVVISIGGNDIALAPLLCTCCNVAPLLCVGALCGDAIDHCACACPPDVYTPCAGATDCGCACCGLPGCLVGLCGSPPVSFAASSPRCELICAQVPSRLGLFRGFVRKSCARVRVESHRKEEAESSYNLHDILPRRCRTRLVGRRDLTITRIQRRAPRAAAGNSARI